MQVRFSIAKIRQEERIMQILVCEKCAKSVRMNTICLYTVD